MSGTEEPERLKAALAGGWERISVGSGKVRDGASIMCTEVWLPIGARGMTALFRGGCLEIIISGEALGRKDDVRLWLFKGSKGVDRIRNDRPMT